MQPRQFSIALAIVVSVAAHVGFWFIARNWTLHIEPGTKDTRTALTQVTLLLNPDSTDAAAYPAPRPPEESPDDVMGEANARGTGAMSAKGDRPMQSRYAEQDQPFLGRNPMGPSRLEDRTTIMVAPPGENGRGGQAGARVAMNQTASPAAMPRPQPAMDPQPPPKQEHDRPKSPVKETTQAPPGEKPVKSPVKEKTQVSPDVKAEHATTPPPSKTASVGASKPDLTKPPVDEVKETGPIVEATPKKDGTVPTAQREGPPVMPVPASGTAPPTPDAPAEHKSVVVAPPLPIPIAPVAAPPPSAVNPPAEKKLPQVPTPKPASPPAPTQVAMATPSLVKNGDSRAPGQERTSADPAQESDSDSDPFSRKSVSAVMHDGKLEVRDGRKVKLTKPQFLPGAQSAFYINPNPTIVLKISIDETGKVKDVGLESGSNSVEIDLPLRRAAYDWWIEPAHDKHGRAIPDLITFTINFR